MLGSIQVQQLNPPENLCKVFDGLQWLQGYVLLIQGYGTYCPLIKSGNCGVWGSGRNEMGNEGKIGSGGMGVEPDAISVSVHYARWERSLHYTVHLEWQ